MIYIDSEGVSRALECDTTSRDVHHTFLASLQTLSADLACPLEALRSLRSTDSCRRIMPTDNREEPLWHDR